jgi:hypothetical protein
MLVLYMPMKSRSLAPAVGYLVYHHQTEKINNTFPCLSRSYFPLCKNTTLIKICILFQGVFLYTISEPQIVTVVTLNSQLRVSSMLALSTAGNYSTFFGVSSNAITLLSRFTKIGQMFQNFAMSGHTDEKKQVYFF